MVFTARVKDSSGESREIVREAGSSGELASRLRAEGMVILSIREAVPPEKPSKRRLWTWRRMSGFDVEMGLRQLSSMLSSSVTLLLAVRTVAEQSSTRRARAAWDSIADEIIRGNSFSRALEKESRTFGEITVRLAEVGERSGELAHSLSRAADQLESARNLRTAVINALVYPCITLLTAFGVSAYLVAAVIPKLGEFLVDSGGELPAVTRMLVDVSEFLRRSAPEIALAALGAAAVWWLVRLVPKGRELEDVLLLRLPVTGKIFRVSGTAIFSRSLEIMTESGVTLLDALETSAGILGNSRLRRRALGARDAIVSGESLARALAPAREFMPMLRHMAAVGEVSGSLPGAFGETARFHELVLAIAVKRLGMLVEPVMIVVTGIIVGFVYIAFFMALFAIAGAA